MELQFWEKRVEEEMVNGLEEGLMRFCEHCGLGSCWKRGASINLPSFLSHGVPSSREGQEYRIAGGERFKTEGQSKVQA